MLRMLITTPEELQDLCQAARAAGSLALDTEFVWERTYHPHLGIVQLALPDGRVALVDAVALPRLDGLGEVLADPHVELLLHDALQDLQILARHTGALPRNVFDTRRAAGFAGQPSTLSLSHLLDTLLGITITKDETRSDWLQRPLSDTQAQYARADVLHLHALAATLKTAAEAQGLAAALAEEMRRFDEPGQYETTSVDTLYSRLRTARWPQSTRAAAYALLRWREAEAIARNRPRGHILKDADLLQIAAQLSVDPPRPVALPRRCAAAIHAALREAATLTPENLPPSEPNLRLTNEVKKQIEERRKLIQQRATAAGVDPALVANKAEVSALVLHEAGLAPPPPAHLTSGWRAPMTAPSPQKASTMQPDLPLGN